MICLCLLLASLSLCGIEVGGSIAIDTTWSPENNPYIITSFLYIERGATLTILPGTEVRCIGANVSYPHFFMWSGNHQPQAKMIIVHGTINAIGSETAPISFDKLQAHENFRWGGIYIYPGAPTSTFEYCDFSNTFFCDYLPETRTAGAIHFANGKLNIRHCNFYNNYCGLGSGNLRSDLVVYKCNFYHDSPIYPYPYVGTIMLVFAADEPTPDNPKRHVTIAGSYFTGSADFIFAGINHDLLLLYNTLEDLNFDTRSTMLRYEIGSDSSYGNVSINSNYGWGCWSGTVADTVFARKNKYYAQQHRPISNADGVGTNFVSENYFFGGAKFAEQMANATTTYFHNNVIEDQNSTALEIGYNGVYNSGGQLRVFNNLMYNSVSNPNNRVLYANGTGPFVYNNTILDYATLHESFSDYNTIYSNNIVLGAAWYGGYSFDYAPHFINNCVSLPIPTGGYYYTENNIVADPLFANAVENDYSLLAGSPCIDAGVNRADLPEFDFRFHKRIVAGTQGGEPIVDIGAFEYNSVYIGGMQGMVFDPDSGEMIDCVKIQIDSKLPEFSDMDGAFTAHTGAGVYTIRASRWDYEDQIIPDVVVNEGEQTIVSIPMYRTGTGNTDPSLPTPSRIVLKNHPNPFNPETSITFNAPTSGMAELKVYNIKGQMLKTLHQGNLSKGHQSFRWDGKDDSGNPVSSGIYFVKLDMGGVQNVHKMMLMK